MVAKTKTMKRNTKTKKAFKSRRQMLLSLRKLRLLRRRRRRKTRRTRRRKVHQKKRNQTRASSKESSSTALAAKTAKTLKAPPNAKNTSSSVFERSVANFPKFDPEAGSSVYGVSSLSRKDHKRWMLDLRSDWRFFHVVSFVVNFSAMLLLPAFKPEELERGLLFPEECSKLIELMCRLMFSSEENDEKEGEKEVVKETLTIGDWEGQLIWLSRRTRG